MRSEPRAPALRPRADDMRVCRAILGHGSRSFSLATRVLPQRIRQPSAVFYAFCRVVDDAVDLGDEPAGAVEDLRRRLDRIYAGCPADDPVDRSLTHVVHAHAVPRPLLDALLEGFLWDAERRAYASFSDLLEYCARVASVVGVVMTLIMGCRDRHVLARACDLGAAMQLTNIARDVGEDARRGRVYLPSSWMHEVGIHPGAWLRQPAFDPGIGLVVERLLSHADELYARAASGVVGLPHDCRHAIRAAAVIYADIGRVVRARRCDSVSSRAHVGFVRKLVLLARALWTTSEPSSPLSDPPLHEARFLIDAAEPA